MVYLEIILCTICFSTSFEWNRYPKLLPYSSTIDIIIYYLSTRSIDSFELNNINMYKHFDLNRCFLVIFFFVFNLSFSTDQEGEPQFGYQPVLSLVSDWTCQIRYYTDMADTYRLILPWSCEPIFIHCMDLPWKRKNCHSSMTESVIHELNEARKLHTTIATH